MNTEEDIFLSKLNRDTELFKDISVSLKYEKTNKRFATNKVLLTFANKLNWKKQEFANEIESVLLNSVRKVNENANIMPWFYLVEIFN